MRAAKYAILWVLEFAIFTAVLTISFLTFPEIRVYEIISKYAGVIQGDNWDKYYFLGLCVFSVVITALLVFCFVAVLGRLRRK
ncbi:hypothetical protein D3C77_338870 [compost metagenome]